MPQDESYWKNPDGSINHEGERLGEVYRLSKALSSNPVTKQTASVCSCCPKQNRELVEVSKTSRKSLKVWLCGVCDGSALSISRSQPS